MMANQMTAKPYDVETAFQMIGSRPGNPNPLNTSGIIPLDLRVLVLPDTVEEKVGNIFIPESAKEKEEWATVKATLIAVGENAFAEAKRNPDFNAPKAGSRIIIAKYAGGNAILTGKDGVKYRIMNDEDIIAGLED